MVDKEERIDYKFISIVISLGLVAGLALAFTLGSYSLKQMKKSTSEATIKKTELKDAETRLSNLKQLSGQAEELKAKNQTVLAALPKDKDISALFVQFEQIGKNSGFDVTNVAEGSSLNPSNTSNEIVTTANYSLNGKVNSYGALKGALSQFESAIRILSIPELEISGSTGKNLDAKFEITTYLRGSK